METEKIKLGTSSKGEPMHYSAGALIKKDGKYLLIDRMKIPLGHAGLAGHIDEGESPEEALKREVFEESGLRVTSCKLLFEEEHIGNGCSRGVDTHYWYLFKCEVEGEIKMNREETKDIGWFGADEIKGLMLEPMWKHWFEKLGVL